MAKIKNNLNRHNRKLKIKVGTETFYLDEEEWEMLNSFRQLVSIVDDVPKNELIEPITYPSKYPPVYEIEPELDSFIIKNKIRKRYPFETTIRNYFDVCYVYNKIKEELIKDNLYNQRMDKYINEMVWFNFNEQRYLISNIKQVD